ncbi:hypothetical protein [Denitromonas iodatirespirans]|uniref:Uncharacterized protein n=1 Tax=Denitromonas iodatirespirans TaxID=2795389 RepID=A0A944DHF3_DENI1|nr:hypothetical protein [Denitromonas iodatirespirans]MBT0964202.1 hypothetical protein [Denitromonas iodatirespirans]
MKKHSMGKSACLKEMQDKGNPKTVISEIASHGGAYIIVSGKDDCTDKMLSDRLDGMRDAIAPLKAKDQLHIDFYGRDRLSTWLRRHPGVALWARSRLGKPLAGWRPYERWAATPTDQDDVFLIDDHPCVTDANSNLKETQTVSMGIQLTRDRFKEFGSTVRITGLSGVGKTRFVQALFEHEVGSDALPKSDVIYADLGQELIPTASELITYLIANDFASYVVLDNCPPDVHRNLQKQAAASRAKLRLLTIEYDISDDKPEETDIIHLEPTSEAIVSTLLQKGFPGLGQINTDRIAEFSGGNARVALALASRVDADETLANFSDEALFERLFSQRKGNSSELLQRAEVLALAYSFNVARNEYGDELSVLGTLSGLSRHALHNGQAELLRRQLAQQRGNWRAVLPHALANRLAKRALQNIPLEDINAELFKRENLRLLQSCAHRLGYLHDFEPARTLALSWVQHGAPLSNISTCDDQHLAILNHVAPVFPEVVLRSIEQASIDPEFASRENENFARFVRLLCHLAYEDETFDRAATVLLKFAETEESGENNNSIIRQCQQLFSLYLSGTEATPKRRQAFVQRLINSGNPKQREITNELLKSAFRTHHWRGFGPFHFGARRRGPGWIPKTHEEQNSWYTGFIKLLLPPLESSQPNERNWARSMLASHFRDLWTYAQCHDLLERIIHTHGLEGQWPDMWLSIKATLRLDSPHLPPDSLCRLQSIERLTAPSNTLGEIRSYVLPDHWRHIDFRDGEYQENVDDLRKKVLNLGELAAAELGIIEDLGDEIWVARSEALSWFGQGLAKVTEARVPVFELLASSFTRYGSEKTQPTVFARFLRGVHDAAPSQAQELLERALAIPAFKHQAIYLLAAVPITAWASAQLLQLAQSGELEARHFEILSYGRVHEGIPNSEFASLLSAINALDSGYLSTVELLKMRFFGRAIQHPIDEDLCATIRETIRKLLAEHESSVKRAPGREFDEVLVLGLGAEAPVGEVGEIIEMVCEGVEAYRLYAFDLSHVIAVLIKNHLEIFLSALFERGNGRLGVAASLFKERVGLEVVSLNGAPLDRVVAWCGDNQERIQKVAGAMNSFVVRDPTEPSGDQPNGVVLSEHIKSLLAVAKDKKAVVEAIYEDISPCSWSGSRAKVMEIRTEAFRELLNHPHDDVQAQVRTKLPKLEQAIHFEQEREAAEHNQREQRFE